MTDIYLLIFLIAVLGALIFTIIGLMTLFKKEPSKDDWLKVLLFIIISIISFILFGLSL